MEEDGSSFSCRFSSFHPPRSFVPFHSWFERFLLTEPWQNASPSLISSQPYYRLLWGWFDSRVDAATDASFVLYTVIGYYDIRLVSSGEFLIEEEGVRWVIKMAMIEIDTIDNDSRGNSSRWRDNNITDGLLVIEETIFWDCKIYRADWGENREWSMMRGMVWFMEASKLLNY